MDISIESLKTQKKIDKTNRSTNQIRQRKRKKLKRKKNVPAQFNIAHQLLPATSIIRLANATQKC